MKLNWLGSKAVMQGPAKPYRPVRLRSQPPITKKARINRAFLFTFFKFLKFIIGIP